MRREAVGKDVRVGYKRGESWILMSCIVEHLAIPQNVSGGSFGLVAEETKVGIDLLGLEGPDCIPEVIRKTVP